MLNSADKSNTNKLKACECFWEVHRKVLKKKGIDLNQVSARWASRELEKLSSPGARDDFLELSRRGCTPTVLAAILFLFHFRSHFDRFWELVFGDQAKRRATIRTLRKAIRSIEGTFPFIIKNEDQEDRDIFKDVGRLPLTELILELNFYVDLLNFARIFTAETGARSLADVTKYLLVAHVKRATGRFRDKQVSGLLAEVIGPTDFNEVALRMWRSRNYERLDKHFGKLADLTYFMGAAIARSM